jgi:hypothetical protein
MLQPSQQKIIDVLKTRFKCNIEVQEYPKSAFEDSENEKLQSIQRNQTAKFFIRHDLLIFPLKKTKDMITTLEVENADHITGEDMAQIRDCVELVFQDLEDLRSHSELTEQRQAYLESRRSSNVIPLRPRF